MNTGVEIILLDNIKRGIRLYTKSLVQNLWVASIDFILDESDF